MTSNSANISVKQKRTDRFSPAKFAVASFLCFAMLVTGPTSMYGATYIWDSDAVATNGVTEAVGTYSWTPGTTATLFNGSADIAGLSTDIVQFGNGATLASSPTINVSTGTIGGLVFGGTTTSGYTLTNGSASTLTLGSSGIVMNSGAQATSVGSANLSLVLGAAESFTNNSTGLLTIAGAINNGGNLLTLNTSAAGQEAVSGVVSGAGGLTVGSVLGGGTGAVTLTGANTYTGNTTVSNGGSLILNFSGAGAPATNIINNVTNTSSLILSGGALNLTGLSGGTNSQQFNGLTINTGGSSFVATQNGATSLGATLGTITRAASNGGVINFTLPTTGSVAVSNSPDATGLLGTYATVGSGTNLRYATVTAGNIAAYSAGTAAATAANLTDTTGAVNYDLAVATGTVPAIVSANSIRFTGGANTTAPGATSFTVNSLMNAGTGLWTIGTNNITIGANKELVVATNTQGITISSAIANNAGGASGLTYSGIGALTLGKANTYTGTTAVDGGTLTLGIANALAAGSSLVVNAGTVGIATFNQAVNALTINGGQITGGTGTLTSATTVIGNGGTIGAILAGTTGLNAISGTTILSGAAGANTITGAIAVSQGATLQLGNQSANNLALGAAATVSNNGNLVFGLGTTNLTYANVITQSATGTLVINGNTPSGPAGVSLTGATNNIGGNIIINQGRLNVAALTNLGNTTTPITVNGSATNGGQFWLNGAINIANPITLNGYGPLESAGNLGAIRMLTGGTYSGAISLGSNASINPQASGGTISGNITGPTTAQLLIGTPGNNQGGSLAITGSANTFTGGTLISGATAALGVAGALGSGSVTLANFSSTGLTESVANALTGTNSLIINGGTAALSVANNYTGGTTLNGGTLTASAAGAIGNNLAANTITQTGGVFNISTTANAVTNNTTLNLSGGVTNISVANNYTGGMNISGSNVTNISAASALNGTTTVSGGGTLSSSIASFTTPGTPNFSGGTVLVNSGGILTSAAAGGSFVNVNVASGGILNPSGVGTVGSGALTVNNLNTASGSILQFDIASTTSYDQMIFGNLSSVGAGSYSFGSGTIVNPLSFGQLSTIAGTYNLINYGTNTAPVLGASGLITSGAPTGITYNLSNSGGNVVLTISGTYAGISAGWIPATASTFSWNTSSNWTGGAVPKIAGDTATFNTALAGAQTVTVDGLQHVGTLTLNPSAAFAYTINAGTAGSTIYLDNGTSAAQINNTAQNNVINAPIGLISTNTNVNAASGTNLTLGNISGTGKLTLNGGTGSVTLPNTATGSWTGGTEIDTGVLIIAGVYGSSGAGVVSSLNNGGIGTTILNGGTLSFTNVTGTTATPAIGFNLNIGASGGTLNVGAGTSGTGGKLNVGSAVIGFLTGSGQLTKTGGGDLQNGAPSIGFTGNVVLSNNGLIEDQSVAALGFGTTTGFNGGSVTINGPSGANAPELTNGGVQIFNPITLAGGTLAANGNNTGIFNSTVNVTASSTLRASQFQGQTVAQNFAINTLTGSANLAVNGSTTANVIGMVTLGTASGYSGAITVGANAVLGLGSGASFLGGTINNFTNVASGIGLLSDGVSSQGTSTPETIAYTLPSQVNTALFGTGNTTGYIVGKQGATTLFNQGANKIIAPTTALPFNNAAANTLNVQSFNGYGLLLANQAALTATTTFGVGTVTSIGGVAPAGQASNVTPALILSNLTGAFNITKTGVSTLQLGTSASDATNTFGAGGATGINITGGIVSAFADQNLGTSTNGITLNNTTLAEFLALNTFTTSRTITIGAATGSTLAAATGATLTVNSGLAYSAAGNTLTKIENGTVILTTAATGTPTSGTTVNAGALQISNSNQIGSGTITVASNVGAALQLTGGGTFTQAVSINASGLNGAGSLQNLSGAATYNGVVTSGTAFAAIGNSDASNTFTIGSGGISTGTNAVTFTGASGAAIKVTGVVSGTGSNLVVLSPTDSALTLNLTGANTFSGNLLPTHNTTILVNGSGTVAAVTQLSLRYGSTLTLDNTTTNVNNRLGNGVTTMGSVGATFNILGNASASTTETLKSFSPSAALAINLTPSGQPVNLTLTATGGAFTHNAGASVVLSGTNVISGVGTAGTGSSSFNTGSITTAASFQGAGTAGTTANQGIIPWMLLNNGGTISLPTSTVIGASGFLRALGTGETTNAFTNYLNSNTASAANTLSGVATTASTTLTTANNLSGSLFVGQAISGNGIAANTFITAISGTTLTLSAAATVPAASALTFSATGTNLNLTAATNGPGGISGQAGTLTQTINSLTLATNGTLTLPNTNTVLTIAANALGGAILSTDSGGGNTITGGQISGGGQELIFHTPQNLTIASNIIGSGQFTKAESGTLSLTATSFGTGQINIAGGTLSLGAGNNTIQFASAVNLNSGATLNLNGNAQIVINLFSDSTNGVTNFGTVGSNGTVTGTTGATLTLKQDNSARFFGGNITGATGLVISGQNTLTLAQAQTYTGPTLINTAGGTVTLQNNASLYSAGTTASSSLTINRSTLALDNTGYLDSSTRLPTGLAIALGGGTLSFIGHTQSNSAETVGVINTTEGSNTINATVQTTGIATAALTLSGLNRVAGSTVNFTNTGGTLGTIGTNPTIFISGQAQTTDSGTASLLGGGFTVNGNDFAAYNSTYGVGALGTTGFAGYSPLLLNNAASTDNVSNAISTGVAIGSMTVNSLRATGTVNVIQTGGTTLTLASGGLMGGGGAISVGTSLVGGTTFVNVVNQGNVTSGTAGSPSELFLPGGNTVTINSAIVNNGSGAVTLVKSGSGGATLSGTNTYTGGTYVNQGTLTLGVTGSNLGNGTVGNNTVSGHSTLGTGGIFLNGGNLTQTAGSLINSGTPQAVTITGSSTLTTTSDLVTATSSVTTLGSNIITVPNGTLGVSGIHVGDLVSGTGIPGNEYVTAVNPTNNTVTITTGSGVLNGAVALTFRNLANSISSLTFNNDGGSSPTLTNTGLLNITSGAITASSNNVGGASTASVNTLTGGNVDLNNVSTPTITVNPITFNGQNLAPYQPTLIVNSALQNANNQLQVTGGGNLQLGGASTFTGGVKIANGTSLTIGANSTNNAAGQPLSGPLGTGTLTIGTGSTLYSTGTFTVGNNVVVSGNFNFDAPSTTAASLTLGTGSQTIALPSSANTTINVNAANMTGVLNSTVTGSGSSITKTGNGVLQLNNALGSTSTFSGGVTVNGGTLLATGVGSTGTALGTGSVLLSNGVLSLQHNGVASNGQILYGNNVQINTAQANAYINVNNNGSNTGNTIIMGSLDYGTVSGSTFTSTVSSSLTPSTILNVIGANNYKLQFTGTTLTSTTSPATFNIGSGLSLILPGGFNTATNLPVNIGLGTLIYSGANTGTAPLTISNTTQVSLGANQTNTPLGTGGITLNTGSTLQMVPYYTSSVSTTGYITGGLNAKVYSTGGGAALSAANYGIAPGATLLGVQANDSLMRQAPAQITAAGTLNTLVVYNGLLNITTGGTYNFAGSSDDFANLVIDGQLVQNQGVSQNYGFAPITLAAGTHTITLREMNFGGGGTASVYYSGPDTAGNGITGLTAGGNNFQAISLSATSYANGYTAANNYQNAAILNNAITVAAAASTTIDGLGTDFNYAIPSLTIGNGGTLNVANGTGLTVGSIGNGAFIVTGLTTLGTTPTISPSTGTIVLAGGVSDGGNGLIKTGQGNLILANPSNLTSFTGALNINGGFVQLQDGNALTSGTTTIGVAATTPATLDLNGQALTKAAAIVLNGGAGPANRGSAVPAGLYNSSATTASFFTGSTMSIGAAITAVNASIGGFGNIDLTNVAISGVSANALDKVGPDTLILGNSNTFVGTFNIKAGIVQLTGSTGFTSDVTNAVVESSGASIDLNGQSVSTAKPLTVAGSGVTGLGTPNSLGALINSASGNSSYAGNLTLTATTLIGGPSLQSGVNGGITLSGTQSGAFQITKIGGNNLTLNGTSSAVTLLDLQAGSVTLQNGIRVGATSTSFVRQGTVLTLDNTATATNNRLGTSAGDFGLWLSGGLVINGNSSTAVAETLNQGGNNIAVGGGTTNNSGGNNTATFANGYGGASITINATGTAGVTLQVASTSTSIFNRGQGSSMVIAADNLGGTPGANTATIIGNATSLGLSTNNGQATGQTGAFGAANALIYPWAVVSTSASGLPTAFASYNGNTNGIAPLTGTNGNAANAVTAIPSAVIGASANTTNANATVNINTSGLGLSAGMEVIGAGIAAGTTISSFTATTVVLSANATATANTQLTFLSPVTGGFAVPNVVTTSTTNNLNSISTAQSINSLTLNNPGNSSTVTINPASLQIDSGGILAVGNNSATTSYTINGPGTLTGTNTLARELIFHVVGSNTTLTVNAPIFGNQNIGNGLLNANNGTAPPNVGLTKADGGTLVLGAVETYTGDTVINGGTLRLAGGNNTIFRPFTTAPTPGNAGATSTFQNVTVNSGGTLDLNGTNQTFGNLRSGSGTQLAGGTIINSNATASTLSVSLNTSQTWAGNISNGQTIGTVTSNSVGLSGSASGGTLNFVRDGNNTLTVNSPNTLGGSVTILGGATRLIDLGTFQNASAINITDSVLIWDNSGVQGVSNRLSSSAPINLTGGGFQFVSRAGTGSNPLDAISLGTLNLGLGNNSINPTTVGQGGGSQITFAGIGTRATGATISFNGGNAVGLVVGDNPKVFFTSAPALTNGLIGAWATASGIGAQTATFATYDPATGVRPLQYTAVNTFGSGQNTLVSASVTIPAPISSTGTTTTTNSLTISGASTLSFTNPNDILVIQSGGIVQSSANNSAIGSLTVPGQIQTGAGNDLYVNLLQNTMTINSKIIDNGFNNNVIFATVNGNNTPAATLTNANTYGGTTYVNGVNLNLNSLLGPAILGNVIISGGNSQGDSLGYDQSSLNWSASNQLATTANITMNGATRLNLGNSTSALPNQNFSNTQTINNLTFNNIGGTNGLNGPTVFTGAGALTINGTVNSTNLVSTATVPTINGFIVLANGATSGSTAINVDLNQYIPNNVGLNINANIALGSNTSFTKTGLGYLGIGGQSHNLVGSTFNLSAGGLAFSPSTGSASSVLGSAVVMAASTTIDTRGNNAGTGYGGLVLGSLASSNTSAVIMNGVQGTSGNLSTGLDNSSTSYAGSFSSPYPTGLLNVSKIGSGTWTLTGNSNTSANGTLTVQAGVVTVNSTGVENFQSYTLNTGGTLLIDNEASALNNRLGGAFFTTIGTTVPTVRTLNMQGGNLTVNGNSGAAVSESLGTVNITGGGIITLNAASTAGVNLTLQSFASQGGQTSLLIRGDNLGSAVGANNASVTFATAGATGTAPGLAVFGGNGANGTFTRSIRPDILVDPSATGNGTSFLTFDSTSGLVRPLNSTTELQNFVITGTAANTNVSLSTVSYGSATNSTNNMLLNSGNFAANATNSVASLTLQSGGGVNLAIVPSNPFGANGALLNFANTVSGGLLNLAGNNTITAGQYSYGTQTQDFHVLTGSTLTVNAQIGGTSGGFTKADGGTLVLNGPFTGNNAQTVTINGGTLQFGGTSASISTVTTAGTSATVPLGSNIQVGSIVTGTGITAGTTVTAYNASTGALTLSKAATAGTSNLTYATSAGSNGAGVNPLYVYINSGGAPSSENLAINNGTLDLNGTNQLVGTLTSQNPLPNSNIVITNTNATTTSTFTTNGAASVFSGSFQGNLNLDKAGNSTTFGNNTMTLSSAQTYTGTTTIRVGALVLRDSATLASPTINANFAELTLDNSGLSLNNARISSTAAVNLNGGALRINTSSAASTENFGTITLNGGSNLFYVNQFGNNTQDSAPTFNIANLVVNIGSTLDLLVAPNGTAGSFSGASGHVFISQLNGAAFSAANLVNGIIGPQYVVYGNNNQFNWASYSNLGGVTTPNVTIGGITTPNYGALGGGITANASINATTQSVVGQTLNTFAILNPTATTTFGLNGTTDQLVLAAGGLLVSNSNNQGMAIQGGSITAGSLNTPSTLYLQVGTQNTITINTPIVNNGATLSGTTGLWSGGTGPLSVTRSTGSMTVNLVPQVVETFTFAASAAATTTLTVPNATGLFVGMGVSGGLVASGTTITGIAGNVITLSTATTANGTAANVAQLVFTPPASAATSTTTVGTNSVTTAANAFATGFTPAIGMTIGGTNIPGGTTITGVSGSNAAGFTLTLSQNALATSATNTLTVGAINNAYTGTTTINSSTDIASGGTTFLSGLPGTITVPGNLTINGGATVTQGIATQSLSTTTTSTLTVSNNVGLYVGQSVTGNNIPANTTITAIAGNTVTLSAAMTAAATGVTVTFGGAQGQIASTSAVTINGSGTLTLVGTNRFSAPLTFNNSGGNAAPTVNVGTLLDYSSASAISANNDNTGFTPLITGGTVNFSNATGTTINVTGASLNDLSIASQITTNAIGTTTSNGAGAVLTKTGAGSLILPNANAASLTWALNGGSIFVGNATALGVNASAGALSLSGNVGLASATSGSLGIALPTIFTGPTNLTLGNGYGSSTVTLSGAMNLNGQAPTFTVPVATQTNTISGQITGSGGFSKAGPGALTLTPGTASTFTGPVVVAGGLITLGNANGLASATGTGANVAADVTVGTTAEINIAAFSQNFGSLAGGGIVTNSGAAAALTIGNAGNATNATFSGSLVAATAANLSVIKTGATNQTLSGQSYYTGVTTVSAGTLTLANSATGSLASTGNAATPTVALTAAQTPTLANTAVTVASGATLGINTTAANAATKSTVTVAGTVLSSGVQMNAVSIGNTTTTASGASLTLAAGSNFGFSTTNSALSTLNIIQGATFASSGLIVSGTSVSPTAFSFNIGSAGADTIFVTKNATVTNSGGATITLNPLAGTTSIPLGIIPLIEAGGGFTGTGTNNFTLATPTITLGPKTYTLSLSGAQNTTTQTALNVSVVTSTAYWAGAVDTNWSTNTSGVTNWRTAATGNVDTQTAPTSVTDVFFNTTAPVATNLTTNVTGAPTSIKSLTVTSAATSPVTIGDGGTVANNLTVGTGGINAQASSGALTVNANVVLGTAQTWTNAGSNKVTINGTSGGGTITGTDTNLTIANTGTGSTVINAAIQTGVGTLTNSSGTTVLTGTNTYTGATNINGGTLQVGVAGVGSTKVDSAVTVNGVTSVLAGTGTVNGSVTVTLGAIRPGDSAGLGVGTLNIGGTLTVGTTAATTGTLSHGLIAAGYTDVAFSAAYDGSFNALTYLDNAKSAASGDPFASALINSWKYTPTTSQNDYIKVNGTLTLNTLSALELTDASSGGALISSLQIGSVFNLMDWSGVRTGSAGATPTLLTPTLDTALTAAGLAFDTSAYSTYGVIVVVPEPSRVLLLLFSILALGLRRRRKY